MFVASGCDGRVRRQDISGMRLRRRGRRRSSHVRVRSYLGTAAELSWKHANQRITYARPFPLTPMDSFSTTPTRPSRKGKDREMSPRDGPQPTDIDDKLMALRRRQAGFVIYLFNFTPLCCNLHPPFTFTQCDSDKGKGRQR